jgi:hypothetical protein
MPLPSKTPASWKTNFDSSIMSHLKKTVQGSKYEIITRCCKMFIPDPIPDLGSNKKEEEKKHKLSQLFFAIN